MNKHGFNKPEVQHDKTKVQLYNEDQFGLEENQMINGEAKKDLSNT